MRNSKKPNAVVSEVADRGGEHIACFRSEVFGAASFMCCKVRSPQ